MNGSRILAIALSTFATAGAMAAACDGFVDVDDSNTTYCTAVRYIKDHGITIGCTDGNHYCPNDYVTRLQMALFLQRAGYSDPTNVLVQSENTIGGGTNNTAGGTIGTYNVVGGGEGNSATGGNAFVGGGYENVAAGTGSVVGGGSSNDASGKGSAVVGGDQNNATAFGSAVVAGKSNIASGVDSAVVNGFANVAQGDYSMAGGYRAKATTTGSFMWADSSNFDFTPSVNNFFGVRATGGVGFTVAIDGTTGGPTQFCNLLPGTPSWQCTSDRNAKEHLVAADGKDVLDRLVAMPVYTYSFKGADPSIRSLGPMAQDFFASFGLGQDNKMVASINLEGVALAAIQGLNAKLTNEAKDKDALIADLTARLERVEQLLAH